MEFEFDEEKDQEIQREEVSAASESTDDAHQEIITSRYFKKEIPLSSP
jgi:hypothetical protein